MNDSKLPSDSPLGGKETVNKSKTKKSARRASSSMKLVVNQRRELNINDRRALLEAADDLKSQGNLRILIEDDTEEAWAILMGAKALEKLANTEASGAGRYCMYCHGKAPNDQAQRPPR